MSSIKESSSYNWSINRWLGSSRQQQQQQQHQPPGKECGISSIVEQQLEDGHQPQHQPYSMHRSRCDLYPRSQQPFIGFRQSSEDRSRVLCLHWCTVHKWDGVGGAKHATVAGVCTEHRLIVPSRRYVTQSFL